ncbi:hypothetical protein ACKWTF_008951 [Chironomus riparius]
MSVSTLKQIFDQKLGEAETATTTTIQASATTTLTNSPTKSKLLVANVQQNSTHEKVVVNNSNSCNNASRLKSNQQLQSFNKKSFDKDSNSNSAVSSAHNNKIEDNWVSHHRAHNKMVAKQEIEIEPNVHAENDEDFKYGPGFVSKLKCKYLSLTLRQTSANKQRPSILDLRRSTSLNNLLDEDENEDDDVEQLDEVTDIKLHDKNCISNDKVYHENLKNNNRNGIDSHKTMTNSYPIPDAPQHQHIRSSRSIDKNLNLKRARSVEAILRYDHSSWERDMQKDQLIHHRQQQQQFHRHSVDSDNSDVKVKSHDVTIEDKIHNARERSYNLPPKRLTSLIDDGERPPAGICKQTMRIFEASAHKKRNSASRPIGQEIANKMAMFKCQEKPAISAKKPNIVPRTSSPKPINHFNQVSNNTSSSSINSNNCNNSNNHNNAMNNSEKYAKFAKEKTVLPKLDINIIKNNLETKSSSPHSGSWSPADNKEAYRMRNDYSPVNSDSSISSSSNIMSPYRNSMSPPFVNEGSYKKISGSNDPTSPIMSSLSNKLSNLHMDVTTSTPKSFKNNNLLKTIDDSDIDVNVDKVDTISDNKIKNNVIVELKGSELKSVNDDISSVSLISKVITNNNNNLSGVTSTTAPTKVNYEKNITANASEVVNNGELKTVKENFVVITKPTTKPPPPPPQVPARNINNNTTVMTKSRDNNLIINNNSDKSSLNSDSESSSSSSSSSNSNTQSTTKWAVKKKSWSSQGDDQSSNSIVFNFSDRKDVPDYIEHDGLILRRKRELPKPNESGFVLLGDLTLDSSTDPEDQYQMGPASPCDVEFENANVIPNGKSSIRTRVKEVKFKIQFDDSLTATYEYPSESSLVIDETFGDCDDEVDANFYGRSSSSKLLTSVPLGEFNTICQLPTTESEFIIL